MNRERQELAVGQPKYLATVKRNRRIKMVVPV